MFKKTLGTVLAVTMMFSMLVVSPVLGATIRIEGESVQGTAIGVSCPTYATAGILSNNKYAAISGLVSGMPSDGFSLKYEVYAPQAGAYTMDYVSSLASGNNYVSSYSISVNDGVEFSPTARIGDVIATIFGKYSANIILEAGVNQIVFHVRNVRQSDSINCVFNLDYFDLTYLTAITTPIKIEAENYISKNCSFTIMNQVANTGLSGGIAYQITNPSSTPSTATYNLYAPYDGEYTMSMVCSVLGATFTSDFNIIIDSTIYPVTVDNCIKVADITAAHDSGLYKKYSYKSSVYLTKGNNSLQFVASETRTSDNIYITFLDYIQFDTIGKTLLEAESVVTLPFSKGTKTGASGDSWLTLNVAPASLPVTNTYSFGIPRTGTYDMYLDMGAYANPIDVDQKYLAPVDISINGGEYQRLTIGTSANSYTDGNIVKISSSTLLNASGTQFCRYKLKTPLDLTKGIITISYRVTEKGPSHTNALFYFDKFELIAQSPLASAEVKLDKTIVAIGNTASAVVYPTNALELAMELSMLDSISYSSSDINIATVTNAGVVTAVNPGKVKITATIVKGSVTLTVDKDLLVYEPGMGVITVDTTTDGSYTTVKLAKVTPDAGAVPCTLVSGIYNKVNGLPTSLKNVSVNDTLNISPLLIYQVKIPQIKTAADMLQVFLLDNLSNLQPLFTKTVVQ